MKFFFYLFPLILNISYATTITIENKIFECSNVQELKPSYLCKNNDQEIFVTFNGYGYAGYSKDHQGKLDSKTVSKVVEGQTLLFEIPSLPGFGMMGGNFNLPDTISYRRNIAKIIAQNLENYTNPVAKEFVDIAKKYVEDSKIPNKIRFKIKNGEFECSGNKTRELTQEEKNLEIKYKTKTSCPYYSCKDSKGHVALGLFPDDQLSFTEPNLLILEPKGKEEIITKEFTIEAAEGTFKGSNLYENLNTPKIENVSNFSQVEGSNNTLESMSPNTDLVDSRDFLPKKIRDNYTLYNYLTAPYSADIIKYNTNLCIGDEVSKLINKQNVVTEEFKNATIEEKLTQLVLLFNGQLIGSLIPTDSSKKYGCLYNGVMISPKAFAYLDYIKKINETPKNTKLLSIKEVQALFKKAKEMKDIPFGYKYDGCYARAHIMARRFEAMGISTEKVWIKGDLSVPGTDIRWNFHVAPVVSVKNPNNDKVIKYVIDPSLTDKAVPLDEWVATMKPNVRGPIIRTAFPIPLNAVNMERTAVALSSSDPYLPDKYMNLTEDQLMEISINTMKEYSKLAK